MRTLMLVAGIATLVVASDVRADEIHWQTDLSQAYAQAASENKLLLVHFYSDNCVWCERLEQGAFQDASVARAIGGQFIPVKVHAGEQPQLAHYFGVRSFPTDIVVDTGGAIHARGVSPQDPGRYVAMLNHAARSGQVAAQRSASEAARQPQQTAGHDSPQPNARIAHQPPRDAAGAAPAAAYALPPEQGPSGQQAPTGQQTPSGSTPATLAAHARKPPVNLDLEAPERNDAPPTDPAYPDAAIDGFCPVTLLTDWEWVPGNNRWGAIHLGQLYLFATEEAQAKFLADPDRYAPVMAGHDVTKFFEERRVVEGNRAYGSFLHDRIYLFSDQESQERFEEAPERFVRMASEVMQRVAADMRDSTRR